MNIYRWLFLLLLLFVLFIFVINMMKGRGINIWWRTTRKEIIGYVHFIHLLFKVGRLKFDFTYLIFLFILGNSLIDMSSNLEWKDVEQRVNNVQAGKNPSHSTVKIQVLLILLKNIFQYVDSSRPFENVLLRNVYWWIANNLTSIHK